LINGTYHFLHRSTIAAVIIVLTITILLTHKYTVVFLADKFLKSNDVHYSKIEGTLFEGVLLYDVKYKDILTAKKIQLNYKLLALIKQQPIIKTFKTENLSLNFDKLPRDSSGENVNLIPFKVLDIRLKNTKLLIANKVYRFDFRTKNLTYDNTFSTKKFNLNLNSFYANANIQGSIVTNKIHAHSPNVQLSEHVHNNYLDFLEQIPEKLSVDIYLDEDTVTLSTFVDYFTFRSNKNIVLSDQKISLSYLFNKHKYKAKYDYKIKHLNNLAHIYQVGEITPKGDYNSTLNAVLLKYPKYLPTNKFDANISGDLNHIAFDINSSEYKLNAVSYDFNKYYIKIKNDNMQLTFDEDLPAKIKDHHFRLDTYSRVTLSPLDIDTIFHTEDKLAQINGTFKYKKESMQVTAEVEPKRANKIHQEYNLALFTPIDIYYNHDINTSKLEINANLFNLFIKKNAKRLEGNGNLASAAFSLKGNIEKPMQATVKMHTTIASINELLHELQLAKDDDQTVYDGEVNINSTLVFNESFAIHSTVRAPWLSAQTNSQNRYVLKDTLFRSSYKNKQINIYNYRTQYKEQKFYSNKLSRLHIDRNATLQVDNFYVYDKLILKGEIEPFNSRMHLNLHSDKFAIKTHNMNLYAKTNININVENTARQDIDGNVTLLDGVISYMPQHDYTISDEDIIIVQDMKKEKSSNLHLNVHLNAAKPIRYKTKQADVKFIPEIFIMKEPTKKIKYLGYVSILEGKIYAEDKEFTFDTNDKSEIILTGEQQLNPQLNLKLHFQTIDYKDIIIVITGKLNAPILIFSSNPAMSQNDIMSYILFDEPASTLFDNSGAASQTSINYLLLGTGIKTIFNKGTGIKVDTLNILNNENGTLGYEVGARFNKNIRVLYKNDIASSVILQYSLSPTLRIDVDVHDTGQGVYFVYTKDLEGF
jgi:translocation and assembly module TamB